MRKIVFLIFTTLTLVNIGSGQGYDDGLISSKLSINTGEEKYFSFINEFRSGINKVRSGELRSVEAVALYYGIDINLFPKIDQLIVAINAGQNKSGFSDQFLLKLKSVIDKTGNEFSDIIQFRQALLSITSGQALTVIESEALALIDLGVQEMEKNLIPADNTHSGLRDFSFGANSLGSFLNSDLSFESINYLLTDSRKLPRWFICGVGTLGSAILGGLSGAGSGAQVGAVFGVGGAAVGAIVGGIAGVVGGTLTGASIFCQ